MARIILSQVIEIMTKVRKTTLLSLIIETSLSNRDTILCAKTLGLNSMGFSSKLLSVKFIVLVPVSFSTVDKLLVSLD